MSSPAPTRRGSVQSIHVAAPYNGNVYYPGAEPERSRAYYQQSSGHTESLYRVQPRTEIHYPPTHEGPTRTTAYLPTAHVVPTQIPSGAHEMPSHYPAPQQFNAIYTDDATTKLNDRIRRRCFNCCTTDTSTWRRSSLNPGKVVSILYTVLSLAAYCYHSFAINVDCLNVHTIVQGQSSFPTNEVPSLHHPSKFAHHRPNTMQCLPSVHCPHTNTITRPSPLCFPGQKLHIRLLVGSLYPKSNRGFPLPQLRQVSARQPRNFRTTNSHFLSARIVSFPQPIARKGISSRRFRCVAYFPSHWIASKISPNL